MAHDSPSAKATSTPATGAMPRRELTLWDATSIIVGIIIGAGLYESTPRIAGTVSSVAELVGVWIAGALIALVGALCYAELATTYPHEGGDYVYLTKAFGRSMGFVFAWAEMWVVRPGSVGAMAYVFANYANRLAPLGESVAAAIVYASAAIVLVTIINIIGVKESKWTQNILTAAKVLGLALIFVIAFTGGPPAPAPLRESLNQSDYGLAMVFVLFAYGGWSEVAFIAAEVRHPQRNILRALVWGIGIVAAVYITANLAFVYALGLDGVRNSPAVATEVLSRQMGNGASRFVAALICVSTLGAIHGQIFTGARIYYALGKDHPQFARLGVWNPRLGTPVWSLVVQCVITLIPVIGFGLVGKDGFGSLVHFTTPVYWFFFLLVGLSMMILRQIDARQPRPYKAWGYPLTLALFCLSSLFMLYSSFRYALTNRSPEALWSIIIMTIGYALSFYDPRPTRKKVRDRRHHRGRRTRGRR